MRTAWLALVLLTAMTVLVFCDDSFSWPDDPIVPHDHCFAKCLVDCSDQNNVDVCIDNCYKRKCHPQGPSPNGSFFCNYGCLLHQCANSTSGNATFIAIFISLTTSICY